MSLYPYVVPGVINTDPVTLIPNSLFVNPNVLTSDVSVTVFQNNNQIKTDRLQVSSLPITNYYLPTSLYYNFDQITYNYPVYQNVSYIDVNSDFDLHKKVSKYFFSELYNRYLPEDYPKILDYVRLTEKNVELVKSINEAKNIKTKEDDFAEKIKYLADYIYTKKDVYKLLYNYVEKKNVKWWDLKYYSEDIEQVLIDDLEVVIKDAILE
jgi:hypothetical protein